VAGGSSRWRVAGFLPSAIDSALHSVLPLSLPNRQPPSPSSPPCLSCPHPYPYPSPFSSLKCPPSSLLLKSARSRCLTAF
jgi:hypothetical protein